MSASSNLKLNKELEKIYYSPKGYWRGYSAIKRLSTVAGVSEEEAKSWLKKQAMWQIYLPAPKYIPRPTFDVFVPNEVHQADLLFLPHDRLPRGRKTYKYALTVVDVASRYKEAEPLTTKESAEVATAFSTIYKRSRLKWPKLLQADPGREFMGAVNKLMKSKNVKIRRGETGLHRSQAIVERFKGVLHPWALFLKTLCIFSKNKVTSDKLSYGSGQKYSKELKNHNFTSVETIVVKLQ